MELQRYPTIKQLEKDYNRSGTCDYKKCNAACCRFICLGKATEAHVEHKRFFKYFGVELVRIGVEDVMIMKKDCKYLDKRTLKCKIHKSKSYCCRNFPTPGDYHYKIVKKLCSYIFKKDKKAAKMGVDV